MSNLIKRTEKTADGLRSKLFDVLDALIEDRITIDQVEAVCAVSDQITNSARTELEVQVKMEELLHIKEDRLNRAVTLLTHTIDGDEDVAIFQ